MAVEKRYLIKKRGGRRAVHDTQHLTERCNTDQIEEQDRFRSDDLGKVLAMPGAHVCYWCITSKAVP